MVSANQIPGLLNPLLKLFLQNKSMKLPNSLHVDTNSQKLKVDGKVFGWEWLKMGLANLVTGLQKIDCISRTNR